MECPVCKNINLTMSDRQGIEIDYCPSCRGVWLDRGELDKIIERSTSAFSSSTSNERFASGPSPSPSQSPIPPQQSAHSQQQGFYKKKKRGGFLEDLFDFD